MRFLLLFSVAIIALSCTTPERKKDAEIPENVRTEAGVLLSSFSASVLSQDSAAFLSRCSEEFVRTDRERILSYQRYIQNLLKKSPLKIKNLYYLTKLTTTEPAEVSSGKGDHDYTLTFKTSSQDVLAMVTTASDSVESVAVTLIYGKYSGEWKIQIIETGILSISGLDAVDWYEKSRQRYRQSYYVDAVCNMSMYSRVSRPAGKRLAYHKAKEMSDFQPMLETEIAKMGRYPLVVAFVETKPEVFNIFPVYHHGQWCPTLYYKTIIPLTDSLKLARECDAFNSEVGRRFNGLNRNNEWIIYRAFSTIPSRGPARGGVEFVRKTVR